MTFRLTTPSILRGAARRVAALALVCGWLGCGDDGAGSQPAALVDVVDAGTQCPHGGVEIFYGLDRDGSGTLDADERDRSELACNPAPDLAALVRVDAEPAGTRCPFGGRAVHSGVDTSRDGTLQDDEITATEYLCDQRAPAGFTLLARYRIPTGSAAEIVAASPDGTLLAYTDSVLGVVTFVDVSDPARPVFRGEVAVSDEVENAGAGQPTSVVFTPDGRLAVVAVKDTTDPVDRADPGALVFIETADLGIAGRVAVGVGPDSVAVTPDGTRLIVAIEDEEDTEDLVAQPQARPGSVQVVTIDAAEPSRSTVQTIPVALDMGNNQPDPQPEYVSVSRDGSTAVISLQENNALAVIDLAATPPRVLRFLDAGVVDLALADLVEDDEVVFAGASAPARREPDGVCLLSDGRHFVTANEGDTSTDDFVPGQLSGSRGFSIFDVDGKVVFEAGAEAELAAVRSGMYPDGRSEDRGIEIEGCHVATLGGRELAFLLGERNSAVYVYDVTEPGNAALVQLLPAPMRPESAVTFGAGGPHGALLAVAGEGDVGEGIGGGIWIFGAVLDAAAREQYGDGLYRAVSGVAGAAFSAVSGVAFADGALLAAPDQGVASGRIWRFDVDAAQSRVRLVDELRLVDDSGAPIAGRDLEGLAVNPEGGFVLVSEGKRDNGEPNSTPDERNQILFFDDSGTLDAAVDLPAALWPRLPRDGFSGAAVVDAGPGPGGQLVAVSFRRPLDAGADDAEAARNLARIGVYEVGAQTWRFYFYPLEPDLAVVDLPAEIQLADIVHLGDDRFAVIERDALDGGVAQVKRIYTFALGSGTPDDIDDPLDKTLAADLLDQPFAFDFAGVEGLAFDGEALWVVNDNDGGAQATYFLSVPAP